MADKTLKLEVITPEDVTLRAESTSVIVPGVDGPQFSINSCAKDAG